VEVRDAAAAANLIADAVAADSLVEQNAQAAAEWHLQDALQALDEEPTWDEDTGEMLDEGYDPQAARDAADGLLQQAGIEALLPFVEQWQQIGPTTARSYVAELERRVVAAQQATALQLQAAEAQRTAFGKSKRASRGACRGARAGLPGRGRGPHDAAVPGHAAGAAGSRARERGWSRDASRGGRSDEHCGSPGAG
jgi:hypothetical protein